jgi:hypothetical protein
MAVLPRLSRLPPTYDEKVSDIDRHMVGSICHILKESCWQPRQLGQLIMVFYSFSQSPPFFRNMGINSSNAIIGSKLIVTKGNEHAGKISMSLLLVTKFSVNKLQLPMVTTEFSI